GILNPEPITRMWQQHQDCSRNWSQELWSVLMFQSWHSSYNLS
ncbi:MAG: hypothetical protein GTO02_15515, partial [Candidatus Dadabacteria bacterium]|nr:hypothetical protein [Candidatus Dadabacteria bacterium]